uniref:RNase H type-1 domain-containing protein n=1 Tax=Fagus sylvatica TaxID=28930 RepID=A0A2N9F3A7_FAGSY
MAGETSGPGPSEQEIRMVALERKFDELLSFVQLIAKRNTDDENQRKEDDKDTSEETGRAFQHQRHSTKAADAAESQRGKTPTCLGFPNMTMPPKFKAPEFEKYNGRGDPMIHLQMYCRKMAPYADNEPLLIQTFQDTLTGNAAEWYSQLKKISHWKELADTFLAQYGFNSQIAPDRFDLQRMEKKSNETFREYAQRWREKAARARPPLDEREMIKIFGERIEDALKTKKIVDMTALMALAEQAAKKAPTKKKEGDVQMIGRNNGRPRQVLPTFTMQPIQPRPIQAPAPTQAPAPVPTPQVPARPVGNQPNDNRWHQKRAKTIHATAHAPDGVIPHPNREEPNLTCCPETLQRPTKKGFQPKFNLRFPLWRKGGVNMVEIEEMGEERIAWRRLFYTLEKQRHITPLEAPPGPSTGDACEYHSGARGHSLECCEEFKKKVTDLMENGLSSILDDIVEDEMDLDNLQDEGADWGYFMEDDTDEWRDVDFTKFFQFPCLIVPPGFETPEFEIFYENGDPEVHLQKYGEKMALHLENELLMISVFPESLVFLERYRFNPHSILEYLGLKEDEEPYVIPDPGVSEVIVEIKEESGMSSLPALTEEEEEEKAKPLPPAKDPDSITIAKEGEEPVKMPPPSNITTTAEEEYAGPMVEGLSIHTITGEEDSTTTPPTCHCQQGEEAKMWTCVPLLQRVSSSNEITRKTSNDPHVSKIDNKTNCSLDNIDNSDEEIELPNDILEALERQDEGSKPNIEELEIINLADEGEEPREVKIGTRCTTEQKEALIALLREFHEIFAWSYQDMPGLDTDIVVHKIPLKPECKPVKQALRRMKPEVILKIKEEVEKQLKAGFLSTVTYSDWVANIVPVPKKDGKVRMCVDYRDLNRASPKDNFPLPHIDTLVDNTATNAVFSFMDGFSGYNQIKMAEEDKSKTAFVTHWGTFVYDVMPFGLKNAGATYQRAMVTLFHDMIHHEIEVYVDDMIAKSRTAQDHLTDLRKLFQRLKKYQLRLNPNKCAFGVTSGKLLGFIVSGRGIEIDPAKVQAIRSMPAPKTEKEIRSFLGRINYVARFIAQLTANLRASVQVVEKRCEDKDVPSFYTSQSKKHPWAACWDNKTRLGRKSKAIYYLSKKFTEPGDPLLVDGSFTLMEQRNAVGSGIGAVLVSPKGQQTPIAVKLGFDCTNNMTEYEACIVGLQAALEFGAYELEVFGDSLLIVSQTNGEWQARDPKLIPYQRYISRLVPKFKYVTFTYTPRAHNHFADALATLASLIKLVEGDDVRPLTDRDSRHPGILEYPPRATENEKKYIRRMAFQFFLSGEILYKRTHDATLLRCVDAEEANRLIQEMHAGLMGAHANGPFLARKIMRAGYYWLTMERDCIRHVQTCHKCQMYQNSKNAPPQYLHTMASPWPFSAWGMDVIGAITPKASNGHEFILGGHRLFYQVGGGVFLQECYSSRSEDIRWSHSPTLWYMGWKQYYQSKWRSLPLRILSQTQLEEAEWAQARYEQLNFIDEKRLAALCHGQLYQRRIERAYNKKARPRTFQPGDLVLKKRNMALSDPRGKFAPSYEGPYVVKKAFSGGAIILADMDGEEFRSPINSDSVIKYHV